MCVQLCRLTLLTATTDDVLQEGVLRGHEAPPSSRHHYLDSVNFRNVDGSTGTISKEPPSCSWYFISILGGRKTTETQRKRRIKWKGKGEPGRVCFVLFCFLQFCRDETVVVLEAAQKS